jgi:SAM-dependent methyltransferase
VESRIPWHEDEYFWKVFAPVLFNDTRWAAAAGEVDDLIRLMDIHQGQSILDTCCGVGRHSVELAKHGLKVTGVDRTACYLEAAIETADAENVSPEFIHDDIRQFVRPVCFDGAINMFASFGYFEEEDDDEQMVRNIYTSLKPGGKFLVEMFGKELVALDFRKSEWYEYENMLVLSEYEILDNWTTYQNRWIVITEQEKFDYTFSHRLYSAKEIESLLYEAGFLSVAIYGNLTCAPYDRDADHLVVLAVK